MLLKQKLFDLVNLYKLYWNPTPEQRKRNDEWIKCCRYGSLQSCFINKLSFHCLTVRQFNNNDEDVHSFAPDPLHWCQALSCGNCRYLHGVPQKRRLVYEVSDSFYGVKLPQIKKWKRTDSHSSVSSLPLFKLWPFNLTKGAHTQFPFFWIPCT